MELPTELGSVIGWCMYYDGNQYGGAVLTWSDEHDDPAWWLAGFPDPISQDEMRARVEKGLTWHYMGQIAPTRVFEARS